MREAQPEIHLHKVRFDAPTEVQSMVKYIEVSNVFRAAAHIAGGQQELYLFCMADNALFVEVTPDGGTTIRINKIVVEVATIFFNEALSFVPCFKYADGEDVILFTSPNLNYAVDTGGQFHHDYYGMKHELMECILSEEALVDANDAHVFKKMKLSELVTESKVVFHFPDYLLTVTSRQQLVNLLDFAIAVRNVSMFILVLLYLRRSAVALDYVEKDQKVVKITGPWKEAILYALDRAPKNAHYDAIFSKQFADLNAHERLPLGEFVEELCGREGCQSHYVYGWAQASFFGTRVVAMFLLGQALDRGASFRGAMQCCLWLATAGGLLYFWAPVLSRARGLGAPTVVAARALLGAGSAASVASFAFIATFVPKPRRTGLFATTIGLQRASTPLAPVLVLALSEIPARWGRGAGHARMHAGTRMVL